MKTIQGISRSILSALILVIMTTGATQAQNDDKKATKAANIQKMVEAKHFVFKAETAIPMSGRSRQLTPEYELKVSNDTVTTYLPYFGRAYTAPIDPAQGPINFTSTDFEYTAEKGKKGWEILIKPKDARDVQQLSLSIFTSGYATLQVISTNRQQISFNGHIEERKQKSM